jgi:hypothetical protein
MKFTKEQL